MIYDSLNFLTATEFRAYSGLSRNVTISHLGIHIYRYVHVFM